MGDDGEKVFADTAGRCEMAEFVRVTLTEARGLDDGTNLQAELERVTGRPWQVAEHPGEGHLSVTATIILTAVVTKLVDKAADKAADKAVDVGADMLAEQARKVARWWKDRYLDPPEITVEVVDGPDKVEDARLK